MHNISRQTIKDYSDAGTNTRPDDSATSSEPATSRPCQHRFAHPASCCAASRTPTKASDTRDCGSGPLRRAAPRLATASRHAFVCGNPIYILRLFALSPPARPSQMTILHSHTQTRTRPPHTRRLSRTDSRSNHPGRKPVPRALQVCHPGVTLGFTRRRFQPVTAPPATHYLGPAILASPLIPRIRRRCLAMLRHMSYEADGVRKYRITHAIPRLCALSNRRRA